METPRYRRVLSQEMLDFQLRSQSIVLKAARDLLQKGVDPADMFAYIGETPEGEIHCVAIELEAAKKADWSMLDEHELSILHRLLAVGRVEGMMRVFYDRGPDRCTAVLRVSTEDLVTAPGGNA